MVNLTRIYTRTGDDGTTVARRLQPDQQERPPAGRLRGRGRGEQRDRRARWRCGRRLDRGGGARCSARVQNDLFDVGADLCTPIVAATRRTRPCASTAQYVDGLEAACDEYNEPLETLRSFILPGGTLAAAHLHVARTVSRRAERSVWAAVERYGTGDTAA